MWKYIVGILLGGGLLYLAFKDMNFSVLKQNLEQGNYIWLVVSLAVSLSSHWFRAWRWKILIEAAGRQVSTLDSFAAVLVGYMANAAAPRMGEVARCTVLTTKTQSPFSILAGTVFTERAIDVLTLLLLIGLAFVFESQKLISYFEQFSVQFSILPLLFGVLLVGLLGIYLLWRLKDRLLQVEIFKKIYDFAMQIFSASWSVTKLKNPALFLFSTVMIWLCYTCSTWFATYVLQGTANVGFLLSFVLMIMGGIGMTMPVPGGLGPFHNAIIWTMLAYGFQKSDGEALALIIHTPQLLLLILTGAISYFYLLSKSKMIQE